MVPQSDIKAEISTVEAHLTHITRRWHELDEPCLLELVFLTAEDKAQVRQVNHYTPDANGIAMAVDDVRTWNKMGINAYATVNPVSATNRPAPSKRANASQIVASFFHWADADDAQAAENIRNFAGPKCTFHVLTGTTPSLRPHVYWELEDPTFNLNAWSQTQKNIAATLKTDSSVTDPPRIMRVAGSVNWPKPQKEAKGYKPEVVGLHFYEDREPIPSERMARMFPAIRGNSENTPHEGGFQIDTGELPKLDRERAAIKALSGENWNIEVFKLVGSYVRKGMSDGEILALIEPLTIAGYTVADTRDEVQAMIDRTRANPAFEPTLSEETKSVSFDHPPADAAAAAWRVQTAAEFTADFVAPEYLIDGVIQRGRLYTLTAPTGSGKTAVMLYIAEAMASGSAVCGRDTEAGDVLYLAGENPDDVRARIIATLAQAETPAAASRMHFIPGTFSIRQDMKLIQEALEALPNCNLVVIDTLAAYFDGDDSNSNAQMLDFARVVRKITEGTGKPAVVMPAHPVKNAAKTNLTPMGGSALLNEVDGNLCLWKRETAVELHWQGKHRGADFEPLNFELVGITSEKVKDAKGRLMPTVMARPLLETRALEIAVDALSAEDRLILNIEKYEAQSIAQRCVEIGMVNKDGKAKKTNLMRILEKLEKEKLIQRFRTNWELTARGQRAADIIKSGGEFAEELA
ncbi:AAA family ATPase [Yoonia sp. R2331]|uniref:AAA family ATPase n=1 Tax=Yoonia sp. R2331 TaxID=3237238 RepID=UPI0034E5DAE9